MRILLPVDGSDHTKRMLAHLAVHREWLGAGHEYIAFTAVPSVPAHATRFLDASVTERYYADEAEAVFKPVRAFAAQQGWSFRTAWAHGRAGQAIVAFAAAEHIDLIVMGTHGHSALVSVVLGSVATDVLARCTLPVLLVR